MTTRQSVALAELQQKTLHDINVETATTWAHRAWAAKQLARAASARGDADEAARYAHDAVDYEHEAVEHGALAGDDVLAAVRATVASDA